MGGGRGRGRESLFCIDALKSRILLALWRVGFEGFRDKFKPRRGEGFQMSRQHSGQDTSGFSGCRYVPPHDQGRPLGTWRCCIIRTKAFRIAMTRSLAFAASVAVSQLRHMDMRNLRHVQMDTNIYRRAAYTRLISSDIVASPLQLSGFAPCDWRTSRRSPASKKRPRRQSLGLYDIVT